MKLGVVGYGTVGRALVDCFSSNRNHAISVYDKYIRELGTSAHRKAVNKCDLVFISVPTPTSDDGLACDISAVEDAISWVEAPTCVKSTVIPGTTDQLSRKIGRALAFSPEYVGESESHPWKSSGSCGFVIVGATDNLCDLVIDAYRSTLGPDVAYYRTNTRTAELCKYMENCFLATKVAFVNQFFDISNSLGVDFEELRKLWLADPRVGFSHTQVKKLRQESPRAPLCLPGTRGITYPLAGDRL